jgi:hypothetical protein
MYKKISLVFSFILFLTTLHAQTPEGINYQSVLTNTDGSALANQNVTLRLGVYSGVSGTVKDYEETHVLTTASNGHISVVIGQGSVNSGVFANIKWGDNAHFVKIEVDKGAGFVNMGQVQLQSVPYALYSKKALEVVNAPAFSFKDAQDIDFSNLTSGDILIYDGTGWKVGKDQTGITYKAGSGIKIVNDEISAVQDDAIWNANKLNGKDLPAGTPNTGDILSWDGSKWVYTSVQGGKSYDAGSGLSLNGTTFSANSNSAIWNAGSLQGSSVSNTTPSNGNVLKWNGSNWAPSSDDNTTYSPGTGISINSGVIGADNGSSMWNANKIQGRGINSSSPSVNDVLKWDGTNWSPDTDANTSYNAGTGITITSGTIGADNSTAMWNSDKLQGRNLSSSAPSKDDVLKWNGSNWAPAKDSSGGGSVWSKSGNNIFSGANDRIGINRSNPASRLYVFDSLSSGTGTSILSDYRIYSSSSSNSNAWGVRSVVVNQGSAENIGVLGVANGTSSASNSSAYGAYGLASLTGSNSFGLYGYANNASVRNYGVYSESLGTGTFNMGGFFLALRNSSNSNYGVYAAADSATTSVAGYFDGDLTYTGTLTGPSDQFLKKEIADLDNAMNLVNQLQPKTYFFRHDNTTMRLPHDLQYGFLAQDIEQVLPDLISVQKHMGNFKDDDPDVTTYKSVDYISLIPILTKALQEQQVAIDELKKEIETLKAAQK